MDVFVKILVEVHDTVAEVHPRIVDEPIDCEKRDPVENLNALTTPA